MKKTILVLIINFFVFCGLAQDISFKKCEPPYWYDGYKEQSLLVLVSGKNISKADFSVSASNIQLQKVITLDSPDYVFLDVKFTGTPLPPFFPLSISYNKKMIAEYLFEIRPGPASREKPVSGPAVSFSHSNVDFYIAEPKYQDDNSIFLADTVHKKGQSLVLNIGTSIGPGHPWVVNPPVKDWVSKEKTSRTAAAWLNDKPLLDRYLIQTCLWWTEQIKPDKICIIPEHEADKSFFTGIKTAMEREYPDIPVTECNK